MPQYVEAEDLEKIVRGLNARIRTLEVGEHVHRLTWTNLTLQGAWTNWDPGGVTWDLGSYAKDVFGIVHLRGLVRSNASVLGSVAATLPVGFRPLRYNYFMGNIGASDGAGWYVQPDGGISLQHISGLGMGDTYFSWHGFTFPTN